MSEISGIDAIESYINSNLEKVKTDETGWDTLYFNKATKQYWVHCYPNSEVHGGGQPQLKQISEACAQTKFGV
ncbi:hypothetical protein H3302_19510 [Pseudoalteromonas sp. MT33b]|uniref:Imm27 family immunity protein n=1 Tax=Pseudoalteromonas sp. MT33b TaxID=2759705 RepID=UPI0015FBD774|nr:Imm27 family immunity protein [Pseudoalteromonas sp. MT33b]QMW16462.1 hypothetical protein H3302_19510 [Pseudoalteromonas sp. MT33b]